MALESRNGQLPYLFNCLFIYLFLSTAKIDNTEHESVEYSYK